MTQLINNTWITLDSMYKGLTVQRKYAGMETRVDENNNVIYCKIIIFQRELYPDGTVCKQYEKSYILQDLSEQIVSATATEEQYMEPLTVLQQYIDLVGTPYIVNPIRARVVDTIKLPIDFIDGYPLHKDTRTVLTRPKV